MKRKVNTRVRVYGVWGTAMVPVLLAAMSGCARDHDDDYRAHERHYDRDELRPRAVSNKTPTPAIDRPDVGEYREDSTVSPAAAGRRVPDTAVPPPVTDVDNTDSEELIRQRDTDPRTIRPAPDAPPPAQPGTVAPQSGGVYVQPGASGGYYQDGVYVNPNVGGGTTGGGTVGTVPPGQTQQPGTPAPQPQNPSDRRVNAPPIREIQKRAIENNQQSQPRGNAPAGNNQPSGNNNPAGSNPPANNGGSQQ